MDDLDRVVIRAWEPSVEDYTGDVYAAFEELVLSGISTITPRPVQAIVLMVPILEAAGYAKTEGNTWHWTSEGAARAELLTGEADA